MKDALGHGSNGSNYDPVAEAQLQRVRARAGNYDPVAAATLARQHPKCSGAPCNDAMASSMTHNEFGATNYRSMKRKVT